jgi:GTP cyclohydrolase III
MIRIGVVRLEDYESWIRSLGYDREWKVQALRRISTRA